MELRLAFFKLCFVLLQQLACSSAANRSFTIDYEHNTFVKDGIPFRYVSGSVHYARVPRQYWDDRLQKIYAAGLNAIEVYVPWNWHEPTPGQYLWDGDRNLVGFLQAAQRAGLVVVLRAGPYICGEWDFGGLPAWLLKNNGSVVLRTMDPGYIKPVDKWLSALLPKIKPMLHINGGPVVMVQVENEYGSYFACDHAYIAHLGATFRQYLGPEVVLFTTDGAGLNFLKCGANKNLYTTVDFGPGNATENFKPQRAYEPKGPLVNSEFYTGWLDYWGGGHAHGNTKAIIDTLTQMMNMGANVNMYMFEGGTNFGYTNGADPPFQICPTSYDYDAPLTEAGDVTPKYMAIRQLLTQSKYQLHKPVPVPSNTTKLNFGPVHMKYVGSVLDLVPKLSPGPGVSSLYPLSMEELGVSGGFVLYSTTFKQDYSNTYLNVTCVRDRGYVLLDGLFHGIVDRRFETQLNLAARKGQTLSIIVENQGHINFGTQINGNRKGLVGNVTVGRSTVLTNWLMRPLNFTHLFTSPPTPSSSKQSDPRVPSVFTGTANVPASKAFDSFLNPTGWFKGQAFVNGFNLGRYWPVAGPQVTLYVPRTVWSPSGQQTLMLVELENAPCGGTETACTVTLQDYPIIDKKPSGASANMHQAVQSRVNPFLGIEL